MTLERATRTAWSLVKINDKETRVLRCLQSVSDDFENCMTFRPIEAETGLSRKEVRRAARALARKGLAEFHSGLVTEDGDFAGSGYCCTAAGRARELDES